MDGYKLPPAPGYPHRFAGAMRIAFPLKKPGQEKSFKTRSGPPHGLPTVEVTPPLSKDFPQTTASELKGVRNSALGRVQFAPGHDDENVPGGGGSKPKVGIPGQKFPVPLSDFLRGTLSLEKFDRGGLAPDLHSPNLSEMHGCPPGGGGQNMGMGILRPEFPTLPRDITSSLEVKIPKAEKCCDFGEFPRSSPGVTMNGPKTTRENDVGLGFWTHGELKGPNMDEVAPGYSTTALENSPQPRRIVSEDADMGAKIFGPRVGSENHPRKSADRLGAEFGIKNAVPPGLPSFGESGGKGGQKCPNFPPPGQKGTSEPKFQVGRQVWSYLGIFLALPPHPQAPRDLRSQLWTLK